MKRALRTIARVIWHALVVVGLIGWALLAFRAARFAVTGQTFELDRIDAAVVAFTLTYVGLQVAVDLARSWKRKLRTAAGKLEVVVKVDARALRRFHDEIARAQREADELARTITGPSVRKGAR